jgi:SAM-dependent methyltransferase
MAKQVGSPSYMQDEYAKYQEQYRLKLKDSDAVILHLVEKLLPQGGRGCTIVDIGCHTGNLLLHLKRRHPEAQLIGWDIFPAVIDACRKDPELAMAKFEVMNVLDIKPAGIADIAVLSAVLFRFGDQEHENAWRQIGKTLRPGGHAVVFDFYHQFRQTLRIIDETDVHPDGLTLNLRSQHAVEKQLHGLGFDEVRFTPFEISVDLERKDPGDPVSTYTCPAADGRRLQFRGALYQPWCHLTARKHV